MPSRLKALLGLFEESAGGAPLEVVWGRSAELRQRWAAGQLEEEMGRNSWINVAAEPGIIFDTPVEQRYAKALSLLGIDAGMPSTAEIGRASCRERV